MSIATKLIRGSAVNLIDHGVKVVAMFVTTPLMLERLGQDDYGVWIIALTLIGYLRLLDLGVSFAGTRFLGQALGAGDNVRYHAQLGSLSYLYSRISLASLLVTALLTLVVPAFLGDDSFPAATRWIVLGLGITTSIRFSTRIFEVVLKSHLRYDSIGLSSITKTLIQTALLIAVLTTRPSLPTVVLVFILTDVLDQVLLVFLSRRTFPESFPLFPAQRPPGIGAIIRYSSTSMIASLGSQLRNGVAPLVIAHFLGLSQVAPYSVGSRFLTLFTDIVNAIFGGNFIAAFSHLDGRNDHDALVANFLKTLRFSSATATLGGGMLAVFGPPFIERWIGPSFSEAGKILLILVAPTTVMLMQYPTRGFIYSQDKQHWLVWIMFAGGVFNAVLGIILTPGMGVTGPAVATAAELLIVSGILIPVITARYCRIPLHAYLRTLLESAAPPLLLSVVFHFVASQTKPDTYLGIFSLGAVFLALSIPLLWIFTFSKPDRDRILSLMRNR
jgi:O-antigen/teichoic acid export membrane protein